MEIGRCFSMGRVSAAAAAAAVVLLLVGAVTAAAGGGGGGGGGGGVGRPCFDACFDQCVPREEFWFCQFSCYHRCSGGRASSWAAAAAGLGSGGDCEHWCVLSMCSQLDPESKMMAVCRDTCRKSYAAEGCRRRPPATASATRAAM